MRRPSRRSIRKKPPVALPKGIISIDLEATGLNRDGQDEILQLAAYDSNGVAMSRLYRPVYHLTWTEAERINHISPHDVFGKPRIQEPNSANELNTLFSNTSLLVGWNLDSDIKLLVAAGFSVEEIPCNDVMYDYSYWMESVSGHPAKRYKLSDAAMTFGLHFSPHDAAEDARMTMLVRKALINRGQMPLISSYPKLAEARKAMPLPKREDLIL